MGIDGARTHGLVLCECRELLFLAPSCIFECEGGDICRLLFERENGGNCRLGRVYHEVGKWSFEGNFKNAKTSQRSRIAETLL
jgi:hypothetical protein